MRALACDAFFLLGSGAGGGASGAGAMKCTLLPGSVDKDMRERGRRGSQRSVFLERVYSFAAAVLFLLF